MSTDLKSRVAAHPLWYHTLELGGGVVTPGWFDLRPVIGRMPWPDVAGKRCLDIGTWDGHLAFELERRGAAEVVCTDIREHADWDHLPRQRAEAVAFHEENAGEKGAGFLIAAEALGSKVTRQWINIYDLSPDRLGQFDVVVCGSLLLHLEKPFAALDAVRSVVAPGGLFLSAEQIDITLTMRSRGRAAFFLDGQEGRWMVANAAGHQRMLHVAGFDVLQQTKPYFIPFGAGHPDRPTGWRYRLRDTKERLAIRDSSGGVPHRAALCRRAI